MKKKLVLKILTTAYILLSGSVTKPAHINPVENFQADKYLGKWNELARFDNSFEKGMKNVYAEYSLNPDGTIKV
ncbi:lipocalin family protein, partial [Francisella tularensis subsp. holarctica]|uniref:lipocalin family protein n=1 Tax=Francisella tularensis TaxID=263 RepID=UPI0023819503